MMLLLLIGRSDDMDQGDEAKSENLDRYLTNTPIDVALGYSREGPGSGRNPPSPKWPATSR
jgi:hypothetical protein